MIEFPTADESKITADIDAQWEAVKKKFVEAQSDWVEKNGVFFQLLPTMDTPPKDGATKSPDKLAVKPSYQSKTTAQLATDYALTIPTLAGLEVHQYVEPDGTRGWVAYLTAQVTDAKGNVQTWTRAENMAGNEDYRTQDWHAVADITDAKAVDAPVSPETNALLNAAMAKRTQETQPTTTRNEWVMWAVLALLIVLAIVLTYLTARYTGLVP